MDNFQVHHTGCYTYKPYKNIKLSLEAQHMAAWPAAASLLFQNHSSLISWQPWGQEGGHA